MVTCSNCGYKKNKDDKKFCIKCGKPLVHTVENEPTVLPFEPIEDEDTAVPVAEETAAEEKAVTAKIVCSNCGYEKNKEGRKFCIKCGKPLAYTEEKEAVILPFKPIPDEAEEVSDPEQAEVLPEEVTEEILVPEQAEALPEEVTEEVFVSEQAEAFPEEVTEEILVPEQAEALPEEVTEEVSDPEQAEAIPEEVTEEIPALEQAEDLSEEATEEIPTPEQVEELPKKKRNPYLKYVIALIVVLLILGVLIIALIPDREEASELNNAEITTAFETTYELTSAEATVTTEQPATVSETTSVTTITTTATETTTTVPVTTTVPETTTTAETTIESVTTTIETTTVPVTTTTVVTTVPKTETTTVKTTITAAKKENETPERELITPLDEVPEYKTYNLGGYYDEFEYKFVLDKSVLGEWEAFDKWEGDPSEYVYNKETASRDGGCFKNVIFYNDGTAITSGTSEEVPWTLGYVYTNMTMSKNGKKLKYRLSDYQLWIIDGKEYLFCKAKSHSGYIDTGKTDRYSVFKRVSGEIPKPAKTTITTTEATTTVSDVLRELITPLDQVPEYERIKIGAGYRDKLEYEFILDETVVGDWVSVDFVYGEPSEYDPSKTKSGIQLFLRGLTFNDDGTLIWQTFETVWTCGLVYGNDTISSYELWNIDGEEYLFYEWKSGDYSERGNIDCPYYVLKRK